MKLAVAVTSIWIRRRGGPDDPLAQVELLAEVDGRFRLLCTELLGSNFSHIVEGHGIETAPLDPITNRAPLSVEHRHHWEPDPTDPPGTVCRGCGATAPF